jgi:predicted homoserine dehydrogenase-like protein
VIYHNLYNNFAKQEQVTVGVIGAGAYGTAIVTQDPYTPMHDGCGGGRPVAGRGPGRL